MKFLICSASGSNDGSESNGGKGRKTGTAVRMGYRGGRKEYSEFLHQFLAALKPELVKLGISAVTYFHISDEPSQEQF